MTQRRRWRQALGVLALCVGVVVLVLRTDRAGEWVCGELRQRLPPAIGLEVAIARCEIDPLSLSVKLRGVAVKEPGTDRELLSADEASVALRGLMPGAVSLQQVTVVRPRVDVDVGGAAGGPRQGCPLDHLKKVQVSQLEVQDATVRLRLHEGREVRLDGLFVAAKLAGRTARVEADLRGGALTLDAARHAALGRARLAAELDVGTRELVVERGELNVEGVTAQLTGRVESLCDAAPQLALSGQVYLPLAALPRLGVKLPAPSGQLWSRVSLAGRADAPQVRAEVQASQVVLGPYTPGDFSARLAWSGQLLKVDELVTRSGEGEVRLSGEVQLTASLPVKGRVETKDASFARILERAGVRGAWVEFPASVKAAVAGRLLPAPALSADVEFRAGRFLLASRAYDAPPTAGKDILTFAQSSGRFRLGVSDTAVSFEEIDLSAGTTGRTHVTGLVRLFYDPRQGIEVRATMDAADLSDFGHIAGLPWQGQGSARVTVLGPTRDIVIDGQASLRDFKLAHYSLGVVQSGIRYVGDTLAFPAIVAQKGKSQYFGDVSLAFLEAGLYARGAVQLPDGRVEDVIDLLADLSPTIENIQGPLTGRVSAVGAIDSPADALGGVIALRFRDVEYYQRRLGAANAVLRFEKGEALALDPTVMEGPLGRLAVGGRWEFEGPLDYSLAIENGSLAELIDPQGLDGTPVGGSFVSRATVGGDTDVVLTDGWLSSSDVTWRGKSLGPSHLEAHLVGKDLEVKGTVIPGVRGQLTVRTRAEWPFDGSFAVALPDASPFLPASAGPLALSLSGAVTASGQMKDWGATRATARLEKVALARGEVTAANTAPVELSFNAGALDVKRLELKGPTMELTAQGTWGPQAVDLKSRGSLDLRLLQSFVTSLERTSGQLDFTAAFGGTVKQPALAGRAEVKDVRFAVRGQDVAVRALSGTASFSESRVLLQDFQGFMNEGRVRGRGDVKLERFSMKALEVQVDLEEVPVQVLPDAPVTLSGALLFASRGDGRYQLGGGLDVTKFRYTQPLQLESVLARARTKPVPQDEKPDEWLKYDVDIGAGEDVRVENNLLRARLMGKLKLAGTNVHPIFVGAVEAADGAQAFFRGNTYSLGRAVLQFNGLWPTFDLSGQTQVREYLVTVKAFGRFEDPKVSLLSEPALSEADIVSLLTVGVTTRDRFASQSGVGLVGEALYSASGFDQSLQRFLTRNVGLKDQQVRLTTTYNEATGTAEPSVTWESKMLSDNLKVGVTQPVTGRGTRAQAEYRFNQRVSARAQWDNQNQNTSVGNPGVDLRFRFEWE